MQVKKFKIEYYFEFLKMIQTLYLIMNLGIFIKTETETQPTSLSIFLV